MTVQPDPLKARGSDVAALADSLRRGGSALESVPHQIKQILRDGTWRHFTTRLGKEVEHERFADFVTTPPLGGLGTTPDLVERLIESDPEALALFRAAMKERPGRKSRDVITRKTPHGTSKAYAIERLQRDAPELHAEVIAGRLSAHAAMVQAGYRPRTFTVRADSPESVAATLRRQLDPAQLAELARLLSEDN